MYCDKAVSTTLCQPFTTTTTFAKRAFRCSAPAVWNSLPKTVLDSDSVAVFKSRWAKDIPLFPGFLFFLCSLTRCLAPAPPKSRPYGAIQICFLKLFFDHGTQVPVNEKITLSNTKSTLLFLLLFLNTPCSKNPRGKNKQS